MKSFSHIGLLQFDERGVTTHLARLVYLPRKKVKHTYFFVVIIIIGTIYMSLVHCRLPSCLLLHRSLTPKQDIFKIYL